MDYQIIGGLSPEYLAKLESRFWDKVQRGGADECWKWTAYCHPSGYGSIIIKDSIRKQHQQAHRVAYELCIGPIPMGILVCHSCDARSCVNPEHLFLGTHQDNMQDMWQKGRAAPTRGRHNGNAALSPKQVIEIRNRYKPHQFGCKKLAKEYGVTYQMIHRIVSRKNWTHLEN